MFIKNTPDKLEMLRETIRHITEITNKYLLVILMHLCGIQKQKRFAKRLGGQPEL